MHSDDGADLDALDALGASSAEESDGLSGLDALEALGDKPQSKNAALARAVKRALCKRRKQGLDATSPDEPAPPRVLHAQGYHQGCDVSNSTDYNH